MVLSSSHKESGSVLVTERSFVYAYAYARYPMLVCTAPGNVVLSVCDSRSHSLQFPERALDISLERKVYF